MVIGLHGTNWIASSGTGQLVSYAEDASLGGRTSHGLPDLLLGYVPVKNKIEDCNLSIRKATKLYSIYLLVNEEEVSKYW